MFDFSAYARTYLAKMTGSEYRSAIGKILDYTKINSLNENIGEFQIVADGKLNSTNHASSFCDEFIKNNVRSLDMFFEVIEEKPKPHIKLCISHLLSLSNPDAVAFIKLAIRNGSITESTIECDDKHKKDLIAFLMKN